MSEVKNVYGMILNPRSRLLLVQQERWMLPSAQVNSENQMVQIDGLIERLNDLFPNLEFDEDQFEGLSFSSSRVAKSPVYVYNVPGRYNFETDAVAGIKAAWIDWESRASYNLSIAEENAIKGLRLDHSRFAF